VGLFRKLAELIVEFPEEERAAAQPATAESEDVVAAIERIRRDLEQSASPDFAATEQEEPAPAEASTAQPAPASVVPAETADEPIRIPKALSVGEVYDRAQVAQEGAIDVYRVEEMLKDPEIADLDVPLRARMVRMTLKNMGHELTDLLADAGRRDQALETYLQYLMRRVMEVEQQVQDANAEIKREMDEYMKARTAVIEQNESKLLRVQQALEEYRRSKQAEEQRLFDIIAPFVEEGQNPVQIDG